MTQGKDDNVVPFMPRGGKKSTTWPSESQWNSGRTKTIRVPIALAATLLELARELDAGKDVAISQRGGSWRPLTQTSSAFKKSIKKPTLTD